MTTVFAATEEWTPTIRRLVEASGWPAEESLLVWWGAVPDQNESGRTEWTGDRPWNPDFDRRRVVNEVEHEFVITVTERATELAASHPGYTAWILGHELGHAHMALRHPVAHRLSMFLQHHIYSASDHQLRNWWDLPFEVACDRFGRFVAEKELGAEAVARDLRALTDLHDPPMEATRVEMVLKAQPLDEMPDVLPELRELARRFETGLRRGWSEEEKQGEESRVLGLRLDALFSS